MVEIDRDNCVVCGGLFTIGDWAQMYKNTWVHLRCKSQAERAPQNAFGLAEAEMDDLVLVGEQILSDIQGAK